MQDAVRWLFAAAIATSLLGVSANDGSFKVYWNVPSFSCQKYGIVTSDLKKWDIIQNPGDSFIGRNITILYDPGDFPALQKDSRGRVNVRNGGAPQEGNLTRHLVRLAADVDKYVPPDFSGLGILDMESWRPIWKQLFGGFTPYLNFSREIERKRHPHLNNRAIEELASHRFENASRAFMETSLELVRNMRPHASWGYYAFPYCFNYKEENCSADVRFQNDRIKWLFSESGAIFPSLYLSNKTQTTKQHIEFMRGRLYEAKRVANKILEDRLEPPKIFPYIRFSYHDADTFLSKEDLENTFRVIKDMDLDGVVIWGSSRECSSRDRCLRLMQYVNNELGPLAKKMSEISNFP